VVFPPPRSWKQVRVVDPDREYVGLTSRFFLRSVLRVPGFMRQGSKIIKQLEGVPGLVGWSLGADLAKLEFHTLSAWEDAESLRAFTSSAAHGQALAKFDGDMRADSVFVQFSVFGKELPLRWADAIARQEAQLAERGGATRR
jgi:heme-degrading monooxygenase HmoA